MIKVEENRKHFQRCWLTGKSQIKYRYINLIIIYYSIFRESKGRKVSLPIYTEDDVNDLSDLGIGTSSASGKSSLSEDFDNHSVIVSIFFISSFFFSLLPNILYWKGSLRALTHRDQNN